MPRKRKPLSSEERQAAIEFLTRFVWMGYPEPLPAKSRGRKPKRTQYDEALDRRRNLYRKLAKLPALRKDSGKKLEDQILKIADALIPSTPPNHLVSAIVKYLNDHQRHQRLLQCDIRTIQRIIKKAGYSKLGKLRYLPK